MPTLKSGILLVFAFCLFSTKYGLSQHSCGTMDNHEKLKSRFPSYEKNLRKLEQFASEWNSSSKKSNKISSLTTIPVVVHVLYNAPEENISDEQILSQIQVLNEDFSKNNADAAYIPAAFSFIAANSNIQFCLAKQTPDGTPTTGITRTYTPFKEFYYNDVNQSLKYTAYGGQDAWDRNSYLNIWICNMPGSVAGYAQFPGGPAATDGIVVAYKYFGTTGVLSPNYRRGRIATHEVGHWLNLRHIWGDAQCGNDYVSDTPTQERATNPGSCPSFPRASCGNSSDMFMNYMDYSDDDCMFMFTTGQALRMEATLNSFRSSLLTSIGCVAPPTFCNASPIIYTAGGATFEDGSGTSDYKNNTDCSWLIQPAVGGTIDVNFNYFSTESVNDTLVLYDGPDDSYPLLGKYSGNSIPSSIATTAGNLFIRFKTNGTTTSSGWSISYKSSNADNLTIITCGGTTTYSAPSGTVTDGSGNSNYSTNLSCKFLIQPAGAKYIKLNFTTFNTEQDFDLVKIYDGSSEFSPLIGIFSGASIPPEIRSSGGALFISFVTDDAIQKQGWSFDYNINNSGPASCSGTNIFNLPSGTIEDGSGLVDYTNELNCLFHIQPIGATSITIHFNEFELENGFDSIAVYDGPTTTYPLIGVFTGNSLPSDITSSSGDLLINFISDEFITAQGWKLTYSSTGSGGSPCLGTTLYNSPSGAISDGSASGNYTNNTDCRFLIAPPNASTVTLTFTAFDTESGFDKVRIYNGPGESYPLIGSYSGNSLPQSMTATNGAIYIHFTTDGLITSQGWEATYTSTVGAINQGQCSGTLNFTANSGKISDGSGIEYYQNNSDCMFLIQPPEANSITLEFLTFDTEQDFDFVKVYDGSSTSAPILSSISGNGTGEIITSTGGSMLIHFTSDNINAAAGWYAIYNSNSNTGSGQCSGLTTYTGASGTISDGSENSNYSNNLACNFLIQPQNVSSITLNFTSFDTENTNDFIKIYDGPNATYPLLGTYSGINLPPQITSGGGSLFIQFISDFAITKKGWTANYYSTINSTTVLCSGLNTYTANSGTISDGSGAYNYTNNMNCRFLINPAGASSIILDFLNFNTESGSDYVKIYNGNNTNAPLIGAYSGATLPSTIIANSGIMLLEFTSNNNNTRSGWEATYIADFTASTINAKNEEDGSIILYPNPGEKTVTLQGNMASYSKVVVQNIYGEEILSLTNFENKQAQSINIENWTSGVYIFSCFDIKNGIRNTIRFIKI